MNQFPTLIEYLLLNHDYVVIPGLGTFIVQQVDAQRNEVEEVFLPPFRSVRFNRELSQDDVMVLHAMEEIFSISFQEADQMLGSWVTGFMQNLEETGHMDFGAIGSFTLDDDGSMIFKAHESGVTTPDFYGLDAFHFDVVEPNAPKARIVPLAASMEADDEAITIRINRRIANFFVAACAAILLFVVFNESSITNINNATQRSTFKELMIPTVVHHDTKVENKPTHTSVTDAEKPQPAIENTHIAPQAAPADEYCIVMASAISRQNAENFVTRLSNNGFVSARVLSKGNMVRVVVGHYINETDAQNAAREIRQRGKDFKSAWVYHLTN